jgi:hypothetical protein
MSEVPQNLMTLMAVSRALKRPYRTIVSAVNAERVQCIRVGAYRLVDVDEVRAVMEKRAHKRGA